MSDSKELIEQIKSADVNVRYAAWNNAGAAGAAAVIPLADQMAVPDRDMAKAAKEAMHRVVHFAARPYGAQAGRAVAAELEKVAAQPERPRIVRVETLKWLALVGDNDSIPALVKLLQDPVVREDARLALERIPGDASLAALTDAQKTASDDFKSNLSQSIYMRKVTAQSLGIKAENL